MKARLWQAPFRPAACTGAAAQRVRAASHGRRGRNTAGAPASAPPSARTACRSARPWRGGPAPPRRRKPPSAAGRHRSAHQKAGARRFARAGKGALPQKAALKNNPMCPDARVFYLWRDNTAPCSTRRRQESTTPTARRKVRAMPEREETYKCGTTRPAADAWEMGQTGNRRIPARACGPGVQGRAGRSAEARAAPRKGRRDGRAGQAPARCSGGAALHKGRHAPRRFGRYQCARTRRPCPGRSRSRRRCTGRQARLRAGVPRIPVSWRGAVPALPASDRSFPPHGGAAPVPAGAVHTEKRVKSTARQCPRE